MLIREHLGEWCMPFGFSPYGNQILQKDALEEACQELPQHFNSQREQCINTATDKHSTSKKKRLANSIQKPQMALCFLRLKKVHSSFKNTDYKRQENWMVLHMQC